MRINSILLIPGAGHGDGQYSRGQTTDLLCEADVVDSYLMTLVEYLEEYQIRYSVADTRKPPGIPPRERMSVNDPNTLRIELSVGYFIVGSCGKPRGRNESLVEFSGAEMLPIAETICAFLSEWGKCGSYGHRVSNPILNKEMAEGCIRIKPFAINGPDAEVYGARCGFLGRDIAMALIESCGNVARAGYPIRA